MFAFYPNIQGHITGFDGSSKTYKIRNVIWTEHYGNNWSNQLDVKSPWNLEGGVGDGMCMGHRRYVVYTHRKAICTQLHILTDTADDIQINNTETTTYIVPFSTIVNKGDYHP